MRSSPDSEIKSMFSKKYSEYIQQSQMALDRSVEGMQEGLQDRCTMLAFNYLREHFDKHEVDKLEKSWKEGRANGVKTRKRYMTVSNAKKPKSVESTADYRMQWQADVQPGDIFAPLP